MRLFASIAVAASLSAQPALAQDRLKLAPSSNWNLQYDAESCALQRDFGEDGSKIFLELRSFDPLSHARWQVILASRDIDPAEGDLTFGFQPKLEKPVDSVYDISIAEEYQGRMFEASAWGNNSIDYLERRESFRLNTDLLDEKEKRATDRDLKFSNPYRPTKAERDAADALHKLISLFADSAEHREWIASWADTANSIYVDKGFSQSFELQTGGLKKPMEAMQDCLDNLLSSWGLDAERHANAARAVFFANRNEIASQIEYPDAALREGVGEKLAIRLDISAQGEVTDCHTPLSLSIDDFREETCSLLKKHGKFEPALDAEMTPIPSFHILNVIFRLG